jgi:hypothetical protein
MSVITISFLFIERLKQKNCVILDNAKWHNKKTEFIRISSRSWNKDRIRTWSIMRGSFPFFYLIIGMKNYIRDKNTSFKLQDVCTLAVSCL